MGRKKSQRRLYSLELCGGRSGCNEWSAAERIADTCAALASRHASGAEGGSNKSMRYEGDCDLCCKHKGLAEFLFLCVGIFALAMVEGGKANGGYKNCDSPAARSDPQASKIIAAGGLTSD